MQYLSIIMSAFGQGFIWILADFLQHLDKFFADLDKLMQVFGPICTSPNQFEKFALAQILKGV